MLHRRSLARRTDVLRIASHSPRRHFVTHADNAKPSQVVGRYKRVTGRIALRTTPLFKGIRIVDTPGGPQPVSTINEPGLYSVILRSRKPQAKAFKRWITHEVIPSIRKTGSYAAPELSGEALYRVVIATRVQVDSPNGASLNPLTELAHVVSREPVVFLNRRVSHVNHGMQDVRQTRT